MLSFFTSKRINLFSFFLIMAVFSFSAYLQYFRNIQPCFLDYLERILLLLLSFSLLGTILHFHTQKSIKTYASVNLFFSFLGIIICGRHVWLQYNQIGQSSFSSPSIPYIYSIKQFFYLIYSGGGLNACPIAWQWKNFSLSELILALFVLLALSSLWQLLRKKK